MRTPRKAFILAAGLGTRLRPLTLETPKPMLPLWDRPMLSRTLEMLASWGVREVLINLHHAPGPILSYLARQPFPQLKICCVFEPIILGTGGALRNAEWFIDQPFWLLNADVVAKVDPSPLLRAMDNPNTLAACWLTEEAGPRTVRCEKGIIQSFHDPKNGQATFCGLQLLDPRILRFVAKEGFETIIAAYRRAQKKKLHIAGVTIPGSFWADIGLPAQYVQAHHDTAQWLEHAGESFTLPAAAVLTQREEKILAPFSPHLNGDTPVEVLPPRGSSREFFRLHPGTERDILVCKQVYRTLILIRWSPERHDNRLYAGHTRFLDAIGIPVPKLLLDAPRDHFLVIEDLGPDTLELRLPAMKAPARLRLYQKILLIFLRLHTEGLPAARIERLPIMPAFNDSLYAWEHDYFIENVLHRCLHLPNADIRAIATELNAVAEILKKSPQALIHRDAQSSNILFRGKAPVLIDYQGMRRGAVAYDLASLLSDPYVNLSVDLQASLLRFYCQRHPHGEAIATAFPVAAIQRLCQALGAYAVLSQKPGMGHFSQHIRPAARQLLRALKSQPCPALRAVAKRLKTTG